MKPLVDSEDREQGFTLIELLVVILIIGILSAIAIPAFLNQRKSAVDSSLTSDIRSVVTAQETAMIKTPSAGGTVTKDELNKTLSEFSEGTVMGTWFVDGTGYCIVGYNRGGNFIGQGDDQTTYVWYDSAKGGFVEADNTTTPPTGGACANPRPSSLVQAWYRADRGWTSNF